jgi:hypothetical protein
MGKMRALYVVLDNCAFSQWIKRFWDDASSPKDPLVKLCHEKGEATAWGKNPHLTILDCLTISDTARYADIAQRLCEKKEPPVILLSVEGIKILGGTSLVLKCESPELDSLRLTMTRATHSLTERISLSDEEFKRAEWWIRKTGNRVQANIAVLQSIQKIYTSCGAKPLPSSRHFRMGFFFRLYKEYISAKNPVNKINNKKALDYFLTKGEPPWYERPGFLHITIASGLRPYFKGQHTDFEALRRMLLPYSKKIFKPFAPAALAIMGEDLSKNITVEVFDWLTDSYLSDERPGLKVIDRINFKTYSII